MSILKPFLIALFITLFWMDASALPRFALATGRSCGSCHFNQTGGQLRNRGGTDFAQEELAFPLLRDQETEFTGRISDAVTLGGDVRMQFLQMGRDNRNGRTFQQMQASLYTGVVLHERIRIFGKIDFANADYEVFGEVILVPTMLSLKLGSFLPSYGIRHDDHTLYTRGGNASVFGLTRAGLLFPFNYKDAGAELLFRYQDVLNIQAGVFNGGRVYPRFDTSLALVGRIEFTPSIGDLRLSVGGSIYHHTPPYAEGNGESRDLFGGFLGAGFDRFTITVEFDMAKNLPGTAPGQKSRAMVGEISIQPVQGLDLIARYESFDQNTDAENDLLTRMVFGLEFFPWSFLEVRPQIRFNKEETTASGTTTPTTLSTNQFLTQFHLWF